MFLKPFLEVLPPELYNKAEGNLFCQFLMFNLPDALWCVALFLVQPNPLKFGWNAIIILSVLLPFLHEIMQGLQILPGTFDPVDLIAYTIIFIIFLIIWKKEKISQRPEAFKCSA